MSVTQLKESVFDRLMILWAICLIDHYQVTGRKLTKNNVVADFDDYIWELFNAACWLANSRKLIDNNMQLTPKGLAACQQWQQISQKILAL